MNWIRDVMILIGLGGFGTGLYFYDWRLAAIGVGLILVVVGVIGAIADALRSQT